MNESGISLFKRNGIYYIVYVDDKGTRRQKTTRCKHKPEAIKVLADFKNFLSDEHKRKCVSFSSFKKDFVKYAESNYSKNTATVYIHAFRHFTRIVGDIDMNKITAKHWDEYKTSRLQERVSPRRKYDSPVEANAAREKQRPVSSISVNIELRTLRAAMSTAVRWQLIPKNPFEKLSLVTIPKRTPAFLTAENADQLLAVITEPWLKDFVIFAINTGMRRGEMLSLRWCDVDTTARVARITNTDEFTAKCGEQRVVSLNDAALMVVNRCKPSPDHVYIFSDDEGRRLLKYRITHAFKKAVRAAGLPEGLHLHSTRHSFASLLVGSGTSLFTVSKLLGHSNAKTSEIYSHLLPQHLHSEVGKISIGIEAMTLKNY